jgi:hypothetical protein
VRIDGSRAARRPGHLRDRGEDRGQQQDREQRVDGGAGDETVDVEEVAPHDRDQHAERNGDLRDRRDLVQPPERGLDRRDDVGHEHGSRPT